MINHLSIKDFAIIENIDVDLHPGLNIITGETGAGKSIIIEALSMTLGARADTTMVRSGHEKSYIQLVAEADKNSAEADEISAETDGNDDLVITREISSTGKSLCKLNGKILSLSELVAETQSIADIHGQYDHQSLLDKENHIIIIDSYSSDHIHPQKEKVAEIFSEYSKARNALADIEKQESESRRELDFLQFEVNEINSINPIAGEDNELEEKINILRNGEKIHDNLSQAYMILTDNEPSALDMVGTVMNSLGELSQLTSDFKSMDEAANDAYYGLDNLADTIRSYLDKLDYSKEQLDEALDRLDAIDKLKNKHGSTIEEVLEFRDNSQKKLSDIENIDEIKDDLKEKLSQLTDDLTRESQTLSNLRKKVAEELSAKIQKELNELNFADSQFQVKFEPVDDITKKFSPNGIDDVEFLLSANKGLPPLPLVKIASGGEMSRIMLAIKTVIGDYDRIPTMIFDEIDSGISGITATIVGEKLLKMSKNHQIVCITHLPQIAAFADHHYVIKKSSDDDTTYTTINEIDNDDRIKEIARLLGGKNITENTITSARELIELSNKTNQK